MSEFEFEIKPGERLPSETRMELPELSYEQELLLTPVPFSHRVAVLSDYVKDNDEKRTLQHIAKRLGLSQARTRQLIDEVHPSFEEVDGKTVFEPHVDEVLREEMDWKEYIEGLDELLAVHTIGEALNKTASWVRRVANGLAVFPEFGLGRNGQPAELYPKSLIAQLRIIMLHTPPVGDWYSRGEAAQLTGRNESWVVKTVAALALQSEVRLGALSHMPGVHYPQSTLDTLVDIAMEYPHAGDWLTGHRMASLLSVNKHWVQTQLMKGEYEAEMRLPDSGAATMHYPPETLDTLKAALEKLTPAGDWLTEWGIAQAIHKDMQWVQARIDPYMDVAEMRISRAGKLALHFSPEVTEALRLISLEVKPAGDWMTENGMALALGRNYKWVRARLAPYAHLVEPRLSRGNNREKPHYPPEVFHALTEQSEASDH